MEVLKTQGDRKYVLLSEPEEVDRFRINEVGGRSFSLLNELGRSDYLRTFKTWLRKFPRPIIIICIEQKEIIGWVYGEEWKEPALDGEPVYVLRAIEIAEEERGRTIGYRLLVLLCLETPGYLITKPINKRAKNFFLKNNFLDKDNIDRPVINLQSHPGYLILPPFKKNTLVEDADEYFD